MVQKCYEGLAALFLSCCLATSLQASEVKVAVAANFSAPMKVIAQHFERDTGYKTSLAFGATGQFYAQIKHGAPFHILLAADDLIPAKLASEGFGLAGSRFTYASGRLVLWSKTPGFVDNKGEILRAGRFNKIAIANPKLAPYGAAAIEVINRLGVSGQVKPKVVEAANIAQAFQFVASGNAALGFVALSQVYENGKIKEGSGWIIPSEMHRPIKQDALLLNAGKGNPAATALMEYLRGERASAVIQSFGYELQRK